MMSVLKNGTLPYRKSLLGNPGGGAITIHSRFFFVFFYIYPSHVVCRRSIAASFYILWAKVTELEIEM